MPTTFSQQTLDRLSSEDRPTWVESGRLAITPPGFTVLRGALDAGRGETLRLIDSDFARDGFHPQPHTRIYDG